MTDKIVTSLRRSSRLHSKAPSLYAGDADSSSAGPSTTRREAKPPAKRPRKSAPAALQGDAYVAKAETPKPVAPRGRRRLLSKLVDMPLDILFEIFGHMHPHDLLHLARTTKALRNVLMRRSAITVWRNALGNVEDLPPCPPDLTEPAYANLLFEPHCHFCLKARVMTVLWVCRVRACKACLKEHFISLTAFLSDRRIPYNLQRPMKASSMVPLEHINNKLVLLKTTADEVIALIEGCKGDWDAIKALEQERIAAVKVLEDSAYELADWQTQQNHRRILNLVDLRNRRRKQIIERLCDLGYGEDLKWMTHDRVEQFVEHPLVKQPKELTDRIWNNIKPSMVAFAQEARAERLMRERCLHYINRLCVVRDTVVPWLATRPLWESLPSVADFSYYTTGFSHILDRPSDVAHVWEHARAGQEAKLTLLSKRDTRVVLAQEPARLLVSFGAIYKMYGCLRCRVGPPMTLADVLDHCADVHYIDMGLLEEDFDLHPDAEAELGVPPVDMYYDSSLFLTPIRR
ncbi:hypothetical protein BN946_scf185014.g38 [Trametes cinnabarina]|uniref:F-box domain-containing protein n=1 Tax=Pycnoporus cinnabarinus TaxID=5643 RepID=A0A060SMB3_PYCCI|nr:hypothetical protein BN946_scf185014.g38 [Trametes cinnabarina]